MANRYTVEQIMAHAIKLADREANGERVGNYKQVDYSWGRKSLRLGRDDRLRDQELWSRLPDSMEALLQLSHLGDDDLYALLGRRDKQGRYVINKQTELATVKALCKEIETGAPVSLLRPATTHLFCQTTNLVGWLDNAQHILYGDKKNPAYAAAFLGTAFYLVRIDDETPILHDLSNKQAQTILERLRDHNEWLCFKSLGESTVCIIPEYDPFEKESDEILNRMLHQDFDKAFAAGGTFMTQHDFRKQVREENQKTWVPVKPPKYVDLPYPEAQKTFKKQVAFFTHNLDDPCFPTTYEPSSRHAERLGSLTLYDVTGRPLPDAVVRYAEWRKYLPKAVAIARSAGA